MPTTSTVTTHHQKKTVITSPKQRYYLGENPYSGNLFGKENKFATNGTSAPRESEVVKQKNFYNNTQSHSPARRLRSEEPTIGWVEVFINIFLIELNLTVYEWMEIVKQQFTCCVVKKIKFNLHKIMQMKFKLFFIIAVPLGIGKICQDIHLYTRID